MGRRNCALTPSKGSLPSTPLLLLSGFLSGGDPSVKLSALVVFSVASFDFLRIDGISTESSYLAVWPVGAVLPAKTESGSPGLDATPT